MNGRLAQPVCAGSLRPLAPPPLGSMALILAWAGALELSGPHRGIVLALLPFLLLLASLMAGRYPGERALARMRARLRGKRRRPRPRPSFPEADSHSTWHPRGGALIGSSLAGRAPPAPGL
jgi:hypothetical protein